MTGIPALPTPIPNLSVTQNPTALAGDVSGDVRFGNVAVGGLASVGGVPQLFIIGVGVLFVCVALKALKKKSS